MLFNNASLTCVHDSKNARVLKADIFNTMLQYFKMISLD